MFNLREDTGGSSPSGISGEREEKSFDAAAARHRLKLRRLELGMFGILGGPASAATNVALLTMIISFLFSAVCLAVSYKINGPQSTFWQSFADKAFTIGAGCLTFIFGRSGARDRD